MLSVAAVIWCPYFYYGPSSPGPQCNLQCQTKALLGFKASTNGDGLDSWKAGTDPCGSSAWGGVTCDFCGGAVVSLNLGFGDFGGLSGTISPVLGNLTALTSLDLFRTHLSGTIPDSLGNLTALTTLDLSSTKLSGTLPPSLGNLTALTHFALSSTKVTGCNGFCYAHPAITTCDC
eukprot:SAG22_NODE_779_length_7272_cov_146.237418_3_plen_176_part_00